MKIPGSVKIGTLDAQLTMYDKEKDFPEVFILANASSRNSTGVDEREFENEVKVHAKLNESKVVILRDNANGALVSVVLTCPTGLSRSSRPPLCGGYIIVNEKYRGSKIGFFVNNLLIDHLVAKEHRGLLGRTAVTSRSVLGAREAGGAYLGIIPKSLKIPKWNVVVDDIIVYYDLLHRRDEKTLLKVS